MLTVPFFAGSAVWVAGSGRSNGDRPTAVNKHSWMKTRSDNGNMQTHTGIFVPPIRRVVYGALAVAAATTLAIGGPACADPPARDVEDGSVLGDAELRLTFEPSLALGGASAGLASHSILVKGSA